MVMAVALAGVGAVTYCFNSCYHGGLNCWCYECCMGGFLWLFLHIAFFLLNV